MNYIICVISVIGIMFNWYVICNFKYLEENININKTFVENVDNKMCSNDEILTDKVDNF